MRTEGDPFGRMFEGLRGFLGIVLFHCLCPKQCPWPSLSYLMPHKKESRPNIYKTLTWKRKCCRNNTNTSSMLLRVSIHEKYVRMSEQKIMRQYTSLNRFSSSLLGPQGRGVQLEGHLPLSALAVPCQPDRSLSAFLQTIIFRMTGDFDQPIKLL